MANATFYIDRSLSKYSQSRILGISHRNKCQINIDMILKVWECYFVPIPMHYTGSAKFMATHILAWFSNKNEEN